MSGFESLLTGRVLVDRYRIEEVIGRGGMGAVYRATDERLGRHVAVKVITVMGAADPAARERIRARFRHEAAAAARLPHHPNVVPVYDYGTDPALGLDFIVMELLRGDDLATRLAVGPPPLLQTLEILRQAARGLHVGHRSGVIHRDVKPGNIFIVRTDEGDEMQVRVLDFGIAKVIADEDTFTQLTQDGRAPLSPTYASPEQLRGEARLTPASDVFSLGAVAFQLLTGDRPFNEADRNRMGIGLPVPAPSIRARNPAIPTEVEAVVMRAMASDPEERYPHAGAFAEALDRARRTMGESTLPPYAPPGFIPPGEDRTRVDDADDRTLIAPAPTMAPRAAAPIAADPAVTPPPAGVAPPPRREPEPRRGRGWTWALLLLLLLAGGAFAAYVANERDRSTAARPLDTLPDSAQADTVATDTLPQDQGPVEAAVANEEGLRYMQQGDYPTAVEQFRRAAALEPENAEYLDNFGYALLQAGSPAEAVVQIRRSVQVDPSRVVAYNHLADASVAVGDTAGAIVALERYIELSTYEAGRRIAEERIRALQAASAPLPDTLPLDTVPQPQPPPTEGRPLPPPQSQPQPRRPAPRDTILIP
ncbi:MAG TPA: protein kinase [Longimicrobiaceae bacterium]|jgi:tRNA A-37 threonylcarbamoyl transferase component Bud32